MPSVEAGRRTSPGGMIDVRFEYPTPSRSAAPAGRVAGHAHGRVAAGGRARGRGRARPIGRSERDTVDRAVGIARADARADRGADAGADRGADSRTGPDRRTDRGAGSDRRANGRAERRTLPRRDARTDCDPRDDRLRRPVRPGTSAQAATDTLASAGATVTRSIAPLRMWAISVPVGSSVVADLQANGNVSSVDLDRVREAEAAPSDPSYAGPVVAAEDRLGLRSSAPSIRRAPRSSPSSTPASTPRIRISPASSSPGVRCSTAAPARPTRTATAPPWPASSPPGPTTAEGIAGIGYAGVKVMPVTVLDADGLGQDSDIIAGVVWAVDHGADVINMSFSATRASPSRSRPPSTTRGPTTSSSSPRRATTGRRPRRSRRATGASSASPTPIDPTRWRHRPTMAPDVFLAAPGVGSSRQPRAAAPLLSLARRPHRRRSPLRLRCFARTTRRPRTGSSSGAWHGPPRRPGRSSRPGTGGSTSSGPLLMRDGRRRAGRGRSGGSGGPIVGPYVSAASNFNVSVSPTSVSAGSTNSFTFTFSAQGNAGSGTLTFTIPSGGWTAPTVGNISVTNVTCSAAELAEQSRETT